MPQITNIPDYLTAHGIYIPNDLPFEGPNSELLFKIDLDNHQVIIPSTMSLVDENGNPLGGGGGSVSAPAGEIVYGTGASTASSPNLAFPNRANLGLFLGDTPDPFTGATDIIALGIARTIVSPAHAYGEIMLYSTVDLNGAAYYFGIQNNVQLTGSSNEVYTIEAQPFYTGEIGDHIASLYGFESEPYAYGNGTVGSMYGYRAWVTFDAPAVATTGYSFDARNPTGGFQTVYQFYSEEITMGTNRYYFWGDSRAVIRIKEDNTHDSLGQAVIAGYNQLFPKYTPGATDYERWTIYWDNDVVNFGAEKGGTGEVHELKFLGAGVTIPALAGTGTRAVVVDANGKLSAP